MQLTISLAQMDIQLGEPEKNLETAAAFAAEAARRGSDLLVLPELWSTGYDLENGERHASPLDGGIFASVTQLARRHQIDILGSCLSQMENGGVGNTAVYINQQGHILGHYSKIHLFRLMDEDQYLHPGSRPTLLNAPWGKAGLTICYDLRFPELYRRYAVNGAALTFVPAEWPHPRLAHWQTLLRARAIENQMFIVACNRVGRSRDTDFFGHSAIIDPWGETVIEGGESELLLTAAIDLDRVTAVRAKIPILTDRRPDLYEI